MLKRIVVITTGGTIAMKLNRVAGGAVPTLSAPELVQSIPPGLADLRVEEHCNLPSAHFTLDILWSLAEQVRTLSESRRVDGIVISHGTDTLEETAYLLDLVNASARPVVLTGAMHTASDPGYEGLANLIDAVRTAASDEARGMGVLVVMNGEIHAARDVTKTHATALATFQSPYAGPIGHVDMDQVRFTRIPVRDQLPVARLEPEVHLIKLAVGMDDRLLAALVNDPRTRGVVIEALGGGRVPPWWLPTITEAVRRGVVVVIASRTGCGRPVDGYAYAGAHRDLAAAGCAFSGGLSGPKARIKLMAALGISGDPAEAAGYFER